MHLQIQQLFLKKKKKNSFVFYYFRLTKSFTMKKYILFSVLLVIIAFNSNAQVTQINNNNSLEVTFPLGNNKTIVVSRIDSSIWVTDATLAGKVQISPDIKFEFDF